MQQLIEELFTDEKTDIIAELREVMQNPDSWLDTPNTHFGGKAPRQLVGTNEEQQLRDMVRAIKHGFFT